MARYALGVVVPVVLVIAGVGLVGALDFREKAENRLPEEDALTFSSYLGDVPARMAEITRNTPKPPPPPKVADLMPRAPLGWDARAVADDDFDKLARIPPREPTDMELQQAELAKMLANDPTFQTVQAQQTRGIQVEKKTYTRGDDIIILTVSFRPARIYNQFGGAQLEMMQDMQRMIVEETPFANVEGILFHAADIDDSPKGRRITGNLGKQVDIQLVTNADDQSALAILSRLDLHTLNGLQDAPSPAVDPELGASLVVTSARAQPVEPAAAVEEPASGTDAPPQPVVRRAIEGSSSAGAGGCRMEGAVRRCSVASD